MQWRKVYVKFDKEDFMQICMENDELYAYFSYYNDCIELNCLFIFFNQITIIIVCNYIICFDD